MKQKIVIVGGGIAGLTAATELIERGFEVVLYERRDSFGGKAASVRTQDGRPGEHGFRFFPGWYRHLPDTMQRIPFRRRGRDGVAGASVADNLVVADRNLVTEYDRPATSLMAHLPRSVGELAGFWATLHQLDLPAGEVTTLLGKLIEFARTPEEVRRRRYDGVTWWQFVDAGQGTPPFRLLVAAVTRAMVAAKPDQVSAYTIAQMAIRTLGAAFSPDRTLNGPTNEVWIDPWVDYLTARGVRFRAGQELEAVLFDGRQPAISGLVFQSVRQAERLRTFEALEQQLAELRELRVALDQLEPDRPAGPHLVARFQRVAARIEELEADCQPALAADEAGDDLSAPDEPGPAEASPPDDQALVGPGGDEPPPAPESGLMALERRQRAERRRWLAGYRSRIAEQRRQVHRRMQAQAAAVARPRLAQALADLRRTLADLRGRLDGLPAPERGAALGRLLEQALPLARLQALTDDLVRLVRLAQAGRETVHADGYLFALPVEQMAYYVNRSAMMTHYDPALRDLIRLSESIDWMAGIQFYLAEQAEITAGHIVCLDSEWALTAIEQTQFWREVELPAGVRSILSVNIAAWERKGRFNRKEAFACSPLEIAEEVWAQLEASLNRPGRRRLLRREMLVGGELSPAAFHLDDSIVDRQDARKEGSYEKYRRVRFSAEELLARPRGAGARGEEPYLAGCRPCFNVEPLLINRAGSLGLRPGVRTAIANMFLAGDYVDTHTNLACMEGANEAGRRAVNAILDAAGARHPRCRIWALAELDFLEPAAAALRAWTGVGERPRALAVTMRGVAERMASVAGSLGWPGREHQGGDRDHARRP